MTLTPVTVEGFEGIDLGRDPLEVGATGARDLSNVRLDRPGLLMARGGFGTLNNTALASVVAFVRCADSAGGTDRYMAVSNATVRIYAVGLATHADRTSGTHFSTSTFTDALGLNGGALLTRSNDEILEVPFTLSPVSITGSPRAYFLGLTGVEGRYVAAYAEIATTPKRYRVHFSAPGNAFVWDASDYVDLWPGDGEKIRGLATFRDQVFVFKDHRFAVFYGESVDQDGGVIFNYRPVDVGIGCAYDDGAVATPDGVYFIAADGIYRTTGDAPTLVSAPLQPIFDGATDSDWNGPTSIVTPRLFAAPDRLYFVNNGKVFAYRYATGVWTLDTYSPSVQFVAATPTGKPRSIYFIDGTGKACEAGDTFTTDDGTAISWSYTSGRYPLSDPGRVVITRETSVVGSGTVTVDITTDLYGEVTGTATTLGTAPATAEGWAFADQEGTWFQHTLSGTGPATVSRLTHNVSFVRSAGVR